MSVDLYAICPCGSGKKIKFCKCKDSVSELARVLKMVEGGQVVPALDRLAAILQEHPDAAWALAVRGRLLLDFREFGKGIGTTTAQAAIREKVEHLDVDRPLFTDHNNMSALVESLGILDSVEKAVGKLDIY